MRVGETRAVSGTSATVSVVGLVEESRCPTNVQCVWAGRVRMAFRLDGITAVLAPDSSVAAGQLRLRLDSVTPYPSATTRTPVADYRAYVTVSQAP